MADTSVNLPHMLPDAATFQSSVQALGVNSEDLVVVYDAAGLFSAARAWWMFRCAETFLQDECLCLLAQLLWE